MYNKETHYQSQDQAFLEQKGQQYGLPAIIYNEGFSNEYLPVMQKNWWILSENLKEYSIVGFRQKVSEINNLAIEEFIKTSKTTKSKAGIVEEIVADFILKFDNVAKNGFDTYNLIFAPNEVLDINLKRCMKIDGFELEYNAIYFEDAKKYLGKNSFTIVREKRIYKQALASYEERTGGNHERPDYAVYINGIPFMFIEYKTEDSGIAKAIEDLANKTTYARIPLYVATNARECAVITNTEQFNVKDDSGKSVFLWKNYHEKKYLNQATNLEYTDTQYFYDEILCQPENLYFYIKECMGVQVENKKLVNARIQQYFATKTMSRYLQLRELQGFTEPFNKAILHTQRSGKTITMKMISKMILNHYAQNFNIIFIFAPDLQIKDVITKELGRQNQELFTVKTIEDRAEYTNVVRQISQSTIGNAGRHIYILNMQKISTQDLAAQNVPVYLGKNILNIIDEGHYAQTGDVAYQRSKIFPNASNLLFTATPKSETFTHYLGAQSVEAAKSNILDIFSYSQAKNSEIVVNVIYSKVKNLISLYDDKIKIFTAETEKRLGKKIKNLNIDYDNEDVLGETQLDAENKKVVRELMNRLHKEVLPQKVDFIAQCHNEVQNTLVSGGQKLFLSKSIIYTSNVARAQSFIDYIQAEETKKGLKLENRFGGLRFAIDYSNMPPEECVKYNPGIDSADMIDMNFKSQDANSPTRIDILIAVNKYQKGYDLPELTSKFLDKTVSEPSLLNQIYTRAATKRKDKIVGYCWDITFGNVNIDTFRLSLALYDQSEKMGDYFIEGGAIDTLVNEFKNCLNVIKKEFNLKPDEFLKEIILEKVLNGSPYNAEEKMRKQYIFFNQSRIIFKNISKLASPLYFKEHQIAIKALYDAFVEFKDIYANAKHNDHSKILISLDTSLTNQHYDKKEIKDIIDEVLAVMKEKSLFSLIDFKYDSKDIEKTIQNSSLTASQFEEFKLKAKKEESKRDLEAQLKNIEEFLKSTHKPLYDEVLELLKTLSDDHTKIYETDTQDKIKSLQAALKLAHERLNEEVSQHFKGSFLAYSVYKELAKIYPGAVESDLIQDLFKYIGQKVDYSVGIFNGNNPRYLTAKQHVDIIVDDYPIRKLINYVQSYYHEEIMGKKDAVRQEIYIKEVPGYKFKDQEFIESILRPALNSYYLNFALMPSLNTNTSEATEIPCGALAIENALQSTPMGTFTA